MGNNTIGEWLPKLGATLQVESFWTVIQNERGTHAVVDACVLLKTGYTVVGVARLGVVAREGDHPRDADWKEGSTAATDAARLAADVAKTDYSWLDARAFIGVNCALPWEVPQPKPPAWWRRIVRWLCFWRRRG